MFKKLKLLAAKLDEAEENIYSNPLQIIIASFIFVGLLIAFSWFLASIYN